MVSQAEYVNYFRVTEIEDKTNTAQNIIIGHGKVLLF
jgi:hypothetical protein